MTDAELLRAWLNWHEARGTTRNTHTCYRQHINRLAGLLPTSLVDATAHDLRRWQRGLAGYSDHYRSSWVSAVRNFYRWCHEQGLLADDPAARGLVQPKVPRGVPRPINEDDLALAVQAAGGRVRVWLLLAGWCGLRCAEIAALERKDVHDTAETPVVVVRRGKGGHARVLPLPQVAAEALREYGMPRRGVLFPRQDGRRGPVPAWVVSHDVADHLHDLGIDASAHQLRHRYGTRVFALSRDLRMTQDLLGHASPSTTQIYTQWSPVEAHGVVARL